MIADDRSVIVMAFGQSNADCNWTDSRIESPLYDDPDILCPNDGHGVRGLAGRFPFAAFDDFVPAGQDRPTNQFILTAIAMRLRSELAANAPKVIVRGAAKGGRGLKGFVRNGHEYEGIYQKSDGSLSSIFVDFMRVARQTVLAARAKGYPPAALTIVFVHGEADRSMPKSRYADLLVDMIGIFNNDLADLGVPIDWVAVQAGGTSTTGAGNAWPNRQSYLEYPVSTLCPLIAAGHVCDYHDRVHYSARGKAMLGEWIGHVLAKRTNGQAYVLPPPPRAERDGADVVLTFDGTRAPLAPLSVPVDVVRLKSGNKWIDATACRDGDYRVVVSSSHSIASLQDLHVAYAYAHNGAKTDEPSGRAAITGNLRTTYEIPSILIPGARLWEPVPGFCVPVV